jgi:hypothetical protein
MTDTQMTLAEQLCALMDGELPETQARFLRKRLEHDAELRELWSRMHLASSCMKGQPVLPMSPAMSLAVRDAIASPAAGQGASRSPLLRWGVAASLAVLALMMAPRLLQSPQSADSNPIASAQAPRELPSPSSADLVAVRREVVDAVPQAVQATSDPVASDALVASNEPQPAPSSPMPLDSDSPADFPLADSGDKRSWPRSQVLVGRSDPSLEAYLVRHNQMLANDGLGGFVPYVDVVARDPASSQDSDESAAPATAGADDK